MNTNITIPIPAVPFAPPVYTCHRAKKEFRLDGNINKPFWEDAPYTDEFLDIQGSHMPLPRFVTRAKMLWDDENLYIAADLAGDEIWGHLTERDSVIYFDNDFEIFVDPDSDTYHYYEFEMNVLNTVWDLFLAEPYRDGGSGLNGYDMHGLRTAVHVDGSINDPSAENKGWSVEVVIPFSALYEYQKERRAPKNGEFYRMNFSRVQWNVDVKDNTYVNAPMKTEMFSRKTTGYGLQPVSSIFIIRSCGPSSSSPRTAPIFPAIPPFRRMSTANGSSANCITQKTFCLRRPDLTVTASMCCKKRCILMRQIAGIKR